ncbi:hypothetical protein MRX96_049166 [Rhipicephalus microplus]
MRCFRRRQANTPRFAWARVSGCVNDASVVGVSETGVDLVSDANVHCCRTVGDDFLAASFVAAVNRRPLVMRCFRRRQANTPRFAWARVSGCVNDASVVGVSETGVDLVSDANVHCCRTVGDDFLAASFVAAVNRRPLVMRCFRRRQANTPRFAWARVSGCVNDASVVGVSETGVDLVSDANVHCCRTVGDDFLAASFVAAVNRRPLVMRCFRRRQANTPRFAWARVSGCVNDASVVGVSETGVDLVSDANVHCCRTVGDDFLAASFVAAVNRRPLVMRCFRRRQANTPRFAWARVSGCVNDASVVGVSETGVDFSKRCQCALLPDCRRRLSCSVFCSSGEPSPSGDALLSSSTSKHAPLRLGQSIRLRQRCIGRRRI